MAIWAFQIRSSFEHNSELAWGIQSLRISLSVRYSQPGHTVQQDETDLIPRSSLIFIRRQSTQTQISMNDVFGYVNNETLFGWSTHTKKMFFGAVTTYTLLKLI